MGVCALKANSLNGTGNRGGPDSVVLRGPHGSTQNPLDAMDQAMYAGSSRGRDATTRASHCASATRCVCCRARCSGYSRVL